MRFLRVLAISVCVVLCAGSELADRLFKEGQKAERAGDIVHAYLLYARAAALDPKNPAYAAKKVALRGMATVSARTELGPDPAETDLKPPDEAHAISAAELTEARESLPPPRLIGAAGKKSFDLKGDARDIFERVAAAYGLQVVFEADYQSPPPFTFRMNDVGYEDALRALETVSNSFLVPVNERLGLAVRDTPQKRTERSPAMSAALPIPQRMSVQDAQELLTAVQQTLDIRRAVADPTRHLIFMRDQASKIIAARQMFYNLSQLRPQIAVEIELISIDKNSSLSYGISLPNQISLVNFQGAMSLPSAFHALERLTGAATPFALGITQATAFATLSRSSATALLESQIVSIDGQAATLHVGERYPIATNQYIGNTSGVGQVFTPPPTVNFEDLGLVLKLTPSVNEDHDISLDVDAEFKQLGASSPINGLPVISNRKYAGKVRLKEGEWAVIAGLVQTIDTESQTGYPGVVRLPIIGRIFSQNQREHDSSEVLLVLKPHLTTLAPWDTVSRSIWLGTESKPLTVY